MRLEENIKKCKMENENLAQNKFDILIYLHLH